MQGARMLGSYARQIANAKKVSIEDLSNALHCSIQEVMAFFMGRRFLSFEQMKKLSTILDTPIDKLLQGDPENYNRTVVHCMNDFSNYENRELILDIIDDYLDVVDSIN